MKDCKLKMHGIMRYYSIILLIVPLMFIGCDAPMEPPELNLLEVQQSGLLDAGVKEYAPDEYLYYAEIYDNALKKFTEEQERFLYFRDYEPVREELRSVLVQGNKILAKIKRIKDERIKGIEENILTLNYRISSIKKSSSMINEGRLFRKSLSRAEVLLAEAEVLYQKGDYDAAEKKLNSVNTYSLESMDTAQYILSRYMDKNQIKKWRNMVEATIAESRQKGIVAFIVSKIDQTLMVYKKGSLIKTYNIGLGRNGLKDKLYSGDGGTPEGRYYIVKKNADSKYYKALLFDYPNKEDRARFEKAKKSGQVPSGTGIGSLLEIHGGGADGMTRGCISLDNGDIDKLYVMAGVGTPVTIVGAINGNHEILNSIKDE